jgi:hypothetical protein
MTSAASSNRLFPLDRVPRATWWSLAGLLVGVVGLVVQAVAEPSRFADAQAAFGVPFPPGILFVVAAAALTVATCRWRWHPVFAVLIGLWIVGAGAGFLVRNLASPVAGTVAGNAVMAVGLIGAVVAGIVALAAPRRSGSRAAARRAG